MTEKKSKIRILSIDGGGIRGVIPAVLLEYIENGLQQRTGNPHVTLADYFDLIAGTSTGGILTCCYLLPALPGQKQHSRFSASEAVDMYISYGKMIFEKKLLRYGITREKYPIAGLEKVLEKYLSDVTLAESRKNCLITAYDIAERKAVFFTSPQARQHDIRNYFLRDVARATSAAPTFFELASIRSVGGAASHLIDGGVYAGNPTMCAIVEANKTVFETCANPGINDMYVVSIGTGKDKVKYDHSKAKHWGAMGWARPMIDILLSASAEVVDYQMQQLFKIAGCNDCYVRLETDLGDANPEMDDASDENIRNLIDSAKNFIKENVEKLDEIVKNVLKTEN